MTLEDDLDLGTRRWKQVSAEAKEVVKGMLVKNQNQRWTLE